MPDLAPIPAFFDDLFRRNRPECLTLNGATPMPTKEPRIDPEFAGYLPVPVEEAREVLEQQLIAEGRCRDKLVVWDEENILVDGHTRFSICKKHGIKYEIEYRAFDSRDAVLQWMEETQLGRRNLTNEQRAYYRGKLYARTKKPYGDSERFASSGQNDNLEETSEKPPESTAETIAKKENVSPRTIKRDAKFAEAIDKLPPEKKAEVLAGKSGMTKQEVIRTATPGTNGTHKPKAAPKKPKSGREAFKFSQFDGLLSQIVKQFDAFGAAYPEAKKSAFYRATEVTLQGFGDKWRKLVEQTMGARS